MMDICEYFVCRDAMPTCSICGAAHSGNITCRTCRQVNREAYQQHGWSAEFLDRMDEINPELVAPVGVDEIRAFMRRVGSGEPGK